MTANEKIEKIIETIKAGKTVYISSMTKKIKVDRKTLTRWEKAGNILFKADSKSMYIASGKNFLCIDYCRITFA